MMETLPVAAQDDSSGANPSSVKSDDSSPQRGSGAGSPPPNCAICLGTCKNKSFTDSCLHQFCFSCLLTWSKVKAECPLCKQAFRSIIHNVRSNHQYEEYLVVQRQNEESSSRIDIDSVTAATRRFRYRTTLTLPRRETIAIQQLLLHYPLMADVFPAPRAPVTRRRRSPDAFRRTVYRHNLWARPLPDFTGRFRDCSPDFYRYNDTQMHRLVPWLNRELHYLLNENVGHISYVMTRIMELLPQHHINSAEFRATVQRYFGDRTEHFLHELFCFASTPYDMTGYDRNVQYTTDSRISTMINEIISSSDSEASVDSDIVVMVSGSDAPEPPPGPSRLPAPVYPQNYISQPADRSVIPIEMISHSDTDDDSSEVMVVGYIKPPQDRTPEVVDLLGSDSDVIVQETSQPEPATAEESRPAVKLTLKRQRAGDADAVDSDSDDSYTPPPRLEVRPDKHQRVDESSNADAGHSAQAPRPSKRRRVNGTPVSTDSSLATPASSTTNDWGSQAIYFFSSSSSRTGTSTATSSSSSSSSDESSDESVVRRRTKRKSVRKSSKGSVSSRDRKRSKKRSSRPNHRDKKRQTSLERKRSKRKSNAGKGVKSSKKASESTAPPQPTATVDQAGPSCSTSSRGRKASKERKRRRRDSRETRRLRSVVNVMYNTSKNSGEPKGNQDHIADNSKTDKEPAGGGHHEPDVASEREQLPNTALRQNDSSDSEDNLPLNLTLQKLCPYT